MASSSAYRNIHRPPNTASRRIHTSKTRCILNTGLDGGPASAYKGDRRRAVAARREDCFIRWLWSALSKGIRPMARRCAVTGKGTQFGNNVSHANNKNRRRFQPNLQETSLLSDALGRTVRLRVSTNAIRSIEHRGGIDAFLLASHDAVLSLEARRLKNQIAKARAAKPVAA